MPIVNEIQTLWNQPGLSFVIIFVHHHDVNFDQRRQAFVTTTFGRRADLVRVIIYADETVISDEDGELAEQYMKHIATVGSRYELALNYDKLALMSIRCTPQIRKPDGTCLESKP